MSDDLLERATRALKETSEPSSDELRRTRMRVIETARSSQRRRARVVYVAFPIAAVLVATTAWAASTGRLDAAIRGARALFAPAEPTTVASAPPPATPIAESAPPPRDEPVQPPIEPPPPPVITPVNPPRPPPAPKVVDAEVDDASTVDLTLYKQAHRLHFNEKSYAAALDAWDEYLRRSPAGAFVIEARYNRAICLVKLGRKAEARTALEPFAAGKIADGYRREEASKLLEALD